MHTRPLYIKVRECHLPEKMLSLTTPHQHHMYYLGTMPQAAP